MLWQQAAQGGTTPARAVHDTVAAIGRELAYQRSPRSLLSRFWDLLVRLYNDFVEVFQGSVSGRRIVFVLLGVLAALIIARIVIAARAAREESEKMGRIPGGAGATDSWSAAERLAAEGSYTEAAHALLAALLMSFAARGEVRLHASKTAGDYARELTRRGSLARGGFDAFRRRYDRVIYGIGVCDAQEYEALLRDARPLLAMPRGARAA